MELKQQAAYLQEMRLKFHGVAHSDELTPDILTLPKEYVAKLYPFDAAEHTRLVCDAFDSAAARAEKIKTVRLIGQLIGKSADLFDITGTVFLSGLHREEIDFVDSLDRFEVIAKSYGLLTLSDALEFGSQGEEIIYVLSNFSLIMAMLQYDELESYQYRMEEYDKPDVLKPRLDEMFEAYAELYKFLE
jgi:hypothetical protein